MVQDSFQWTKHPSVHWETSWDNCNAIHLRIRSDCKRRQLLPIKSLFLSNEHLNGIQSNTNDAKTSMNRCRKMAKLRNHHLNVQLRWMKQLIMISIRMQFSVFYESFSNLFDLQFTDLFVYCTVADQKQVMFWQLNGGFAEIHVDLSKVTVKSILQPTFQVITSITFASSTVWSDICRSSHEFTSFKQFAEWALLDIWK